MGERDLSTSPSAHHVQQNTHDKLLFLKLEENNTPIDRNNWLSYLQSIVGRKLATDDDKIELHSSMETGYLEAITPVNHNCSDFHPKDNQKAVYRWYDRKYSEAAWDIYSNDWELRIFEWHQAWHAAHQTALQETNPKFNTNPQLENLPLGKFFLAHPIAGFSLWIVLSVEIQTKWRHGKNLSPSSTSRQTRSISSGKKSWSFSSNKVPAPS